MTTTCLLNNSSTLVTPLSLRLSSETNDQEDDEQFDVQSLFDRLRNACHLHLDRNDTLSTALLDVAFNFIALDSSTLNSANDMLRVAHEMRTQFSKVLHNDTFDHAPLQEPIFINGWTFEGWQLRDFIALDRRFENRETAVSPFDRMPFPEELPRHEFAETIIQIINTIPSFSSTVSTTSEIGKAVIVETDGIAGQRYSTWKRLARNSIQEKKWKKRAAEIEIDIEARRAARQNQLMAVINAEAEKLFTQFEQRQQIIEKRQDEAEKARIEISALKGQLEQCANRLKALQTKVADQEKKSEDLQRQLAEEKSKALRLAQEMQSVRKKLKKKPWLRKIFG